MRFIFDCIANRSWSCARICRELEARGVKPPVGNGRGHFKSEGRWSHTTIRKMIRNRKYVGDYFWGAVNKGKYCRWRNGDIEAYAAKNVSEAKSTDVVVVPDMIPPLIDRDLFTRAGAALKEGRKRTTPGNGRHYLFTHMLACGSCGSYLCGWCVRQKKGYLCSKYKHYGKRACRINFVHEKRILDAVLDKLLGVIQDPARLDEIEKEMERKLAKERSSGTDQKIQKQIAALEKEIASGETTEKAVLAEARRQLWQLREGLEGDDLELQAAVVREVISKIEVRFKERRTAKRVFVEPEKAILYVRPGLGFVSLASSGLSESSKRTV